MGRILLSGGQEMSMFFVPSAAALTCTFVLLIQPLTVRSRGELLFEDLEPGDRLESRPY